MLSRLLKTIRSILNRTETEGSGPQKKLSSSPRTAAVSNQQPDSLAMPAKPPTRVVRVQAGDTLFSLAQRYNITVQSILRHNNFDDQQPLYAGQQLTILAVAGGQEAAFEDSTQSPTKPTHKFSPKMFPPKESKDVNQYPLVEPKETESSFSDEQAVSDDWFDEQEKDAGDKPPTPYPISLPPQPPKASEAKHPWLPDKPIKERPTRSTKPEAPLKGEIIPLPLPHWVVQKPENPVDEETRPVKEDEQKPESSKPAKPKQSVTAIDSPVKAKTTKAKKDSPTKKVSTKPEEPKPKSDAKKPSLKPEHVVPTSTTLEAQRPIEPPVEKIMPDVIKSSPAEPKRVSPTPATPQRESPPQPTPEKASAKPEHRQPTPIKSATQSPVQPPSEKNRPKIEPSPPSASKKEASPPTTPKIETPPQSPTEKTAPKPQPVMPTPVKSATQKRSLPPSPKMPDKVEPSRPTTPKKMSPPPAAPKTEIPLQPKPEEASAKPERTQPTPIKSATQSPIERRPEKNSPKIDPFSPSETEKTSLPPATPSIGETPEKVLSKPEPAPPPLIQSEPEEATQSLSSKIIRKTETPSPADIKKVIEQETEIPPQPVSKKVPPKPEPITPPLAKPEPQLPATPPVQKTTPKRKPAPLSEPEKVSSPPIAPKTETPLQSTREEALSEPEPAPPISTKLEAKTSPPSEVEVKEVAPESVPAISSPIKPVEEAAKLREDLLATHKSIKKDKLNQPKEGVKKKDEPKSRHKSGIKTRHQVQIPADAPQGIYVAYHALSNPTLLNQILTLLNQTSLNTVIIDFKNDWGYLSQPVAHPLATDNGANRLAPRNLPDLLQEFKLLGITPIARIVTFKDNLLAKTRPNLAASHAYNHTLWRDNAQFAWLDPFQEAVWDYILGVALEATHLGFPEIQFDCLRFPLLGLYGRPVFSQSLTGQSRVKAISGFLSAAQGQLQANGVKVSATINGYACWRKDDSLIGQTIEGMGPYLNSLSPLFYPSTFAAGIPGEIKKGVSVYTTVYQSTRKVMARIERIAPTCQIHPWIEDFNLHNGRFKSIHPGHIQAQIQGVFAGGGSGFLAWDAEMAYTEKAYQIG